MKGNFDDKIPIQFVLLVTKDGSGSKYGYTKMFYYEGLWVIQLTVNQECATIRYCQV